MPNHDRASINSGAIINAASSRICHEFFSFVFYAFAIFLSYIFSFSFSLFLCKCCPGHLSRAAVNSTQVVNPPCCCPPLSLFTCHRQFNFNVGRAQFKEMRQLKWQQMDSCKGGGKGVEGQGTRLYGTE